MILVSSYHIFLCLNQGTKNVAACSYAARSGAIRPDGDFDPSHIQEYAGGLLLALEKPAKDGGGIRPIIICGES